MTWLELIGVIIGSSALTAAINNWYARRKVAAEARRLDIDAEALLQGTTLDGAQKVIQIVEKQRDWFAIQFEQERARRLQQLEELELKSASKVKELEKRIDEQDKVISELIEERDSYRRQNEHLRDEITKLNAWKNGVEESGEISISRERKSGR